MEKQKKRRFAMRAVLLALAAALLAAAACFFVACGDESEETQPQTYTITFVDYDGTVLDTVTAEAGEAVEYGGAVPTRDSTAEYDYAFAGWSADGETVLESIPAASANATYTAVYTQTARTYTVTFLSEDGETVLYTAQDLAYNAAAQYVGETPKKDATAQYSYTFKGWGASLESDEVLDGVTATGNISVYAKFGQTLRQYAVVFRTEDGTETLGTQTVSYGGQLAYSGAQPQKEATPQYTYTFAGWSLTANGSETVGDDYTVTGNLSVYAVFTQTPRTYTLRFLSDDGSETLFTKGDIPFDTQYADVASLYEGDAPEKAADSQYTYTFAGWSLTEGGETVTPLNVTEDTDLYAVFDGAPLAYDVAFYSEDGTQLLYTAEDVAYGTEAVFAGETPSKGEGYVFAGWSLSQNSEGAVLDDLTVTGNMTVYAAFAQYDLVIEYVYAEGGTAAESYYGLVGSGGQYSVASPVVKDYAADTFIAEGTLSSGIEKVTVTYTAIEELSFDTYTVGTEGAAWTNGSGTEEDPYLIESALNWRYLADHVNGGTDFADTYFKLAANIDLSGATFAIGSAGTVSSGGYNITAAFAGVLDGDGHVIKGRSGSGAFSAYFGAVTGTVRNLIVMGSVNGQGRLGGVTAVLKDGSIENCVSYVEITGAIVELGGIAAVNWGGTIEGCVNYGAITGTNTNTSFAYNYGGIVGYSYAGGTVKGCVNYGAVSQTGSGTDVGGIAGRIDNSSVTGCENYGAVTNAGNNRTGGIVGYSRLGSSISDCVNHGAVTGNNVVGGIVGNSENSDPATTVSGCTNYGDVRTNTGVAGGIAGYAKGVISGCVNYGSVGVAESGAGTVEFGGIAGSVQTAAGAVLDCTNYGDVSGVNYVGGIVGDAQTDGAYVSGCENHGDVTGEEYVGGVAGMVYDTAGQFADNASDGEVTGTGDYVGDLIGADAFAGAAA